MSSHQTQQELFALAPEELAQNIRVHILGLFNQNAQPGPEELIEQLQLRFGWPVRQLLLNVVRDMRADTTLKSAQRDYLRLTLTDTNLEAVLRDGARPEAEFKSTVDELFRRSAVYRKSAAFKDAVEFMARFRDYAPFNNMLIKLQKPACSFFATARDWKNRFKRAPKDDAAPMLILAPMHPIMLVYDLDSTEGAPLPEKFQNFANATGEITAETWERAQKNAERDGIFVQFKTLSSTYGGYAQRLGGNARRFKMQIVIHAELNLPSRFAVLCHELGHIYLGHLGSDSDNWWPCRGELTHASVEIEAEAVAYIVAQRMGLKTSSDEYLGTYLSDTDIPAGVSLELIAKVAGRIETMSRKELQPRKRPARASRSRPVRNDENEVSNE